MHKPLNSELEPVKSDKYSPAQTQEVRHAEVSKMIQLQLGILQSVREKKIIIDFRDTERVQSITEDYLKLCNAVGKLPTFVQLCTCFGKASQNCYEWMRRNPAHPTTAYLTLVNSSFAALTLDASVAKLADPATAIFCLKNSKAGFRDNPHEQELIPVETMTNEERTERAAAYKTQFQNSLD